MKTHKLKLEWEFCDAVSSGDKPFEVRLNDRGFQKGDRVAFLPVENGFGRSHEIENKVFEISYVLAGWGIEPGRVAFGIRAVENG